MAKVFLAEDPSPESTYARLTSWAQAQHYQLKGDSTVGVIERDASYRPKFDLGGLLFPTFHCEFSIKGTELTISAELDVAAPLFMAGLRQAGFNEVRPMVDPWSLGESGLQPRHEPPPWLSQHLLLSAPRRTTRHVFTVGRPLPGLSGQRPVRAVRKPGVSC